MLKGCLACCKKGSHQTKAKPKLLSDNGARYISSELAEYLKNTLQMQQVHGRPAHPQTQPGGRCR